MTKVLCIGAHNDEIMADMGGTAYQLYKAGCELVFLNLACQWNDDNLSEAEKDEYRRQELASAKELGGRFVTLGNRDDILFLQSPEIIDQTARYIIEYDPDIIFIHYPKDNHVEHREVAQVSFKALTVAWVRGCRFKEVYAFDTGANQAGHFFNPDFAVGITDEAMEAMHKSCMHYDQNHAKGPDLSSGNISRKSYRGSYYGFKFAEVFKIVKYPNGGDDFLLRRLMGKSFRWDGSGQYPANSELYF